MPSVMLSGWWESGLKDRPTAGASLERSCYRRDWAAEIVLLVCCLKPGADRLHGAAVRHPPPMPFLGWVPCELVLLMGQGGGIALTWFSHHFLKDCGDCFRKCVIFLTVWFCCFCRCCCCWFLICFLRE